MDPENFGAFLANHPVLTFSFLWISGNRNTYSLISKFRKTLNPFVTKFVTKVMYIDS